MFDLAGEVVGFKAGPCADKTVTQYTFIADSDYVAKRGYVTKGRNEPLILVKNLFHKYTFVLFRAQI